MLKIDKGKCEHGYITRCRNERLNDNMRSDSQLSSAVFHVVPCRPPQTKKNTETETRRILCVPKFNMRTPYGSPEVIIEL